MEALSGASSRDGVRMTYRSKHLRRPANLTVLRRAGEELERILAESPNRRRVGEILLENGAVDMEDLALVLCEQSEDIFERLSRPEPASYCYRDGLPTNFEELIRLNVTQLLLEGARLCDESSSPDCS